MSVLATNQGNILYFTEVFEPAVKNRINVMAVFFAKFLTGQEACQKRNNTAITATDLHLYEIGLHSYYGKTFADKHRLEQALFRYISYLSPQKRGSGKTDSNFVPLNKTSFTCPNSCGAGFFSITAQVVQ